MTITPPTAIARAIDAAGGPSAVAALLGRSVQAVYFYRSGERRLPADLCARLEAAQTQVSRRDMRPDDWHLIWPELIDAEHPAPAGDIA